MDLLDEFQARRLVNTYADMILRISYQYLKQTYDAEDIFQTVFLKYITHNMTFDSVEHEKAWIIHTAINACKDHVKSSYVVMNYDEGKDAYEDAFYVDAWSREITDYNPYEEMPYPEDIDTEQDGYVYLITENGQKRILNRADYQKWEAALFAGKEPLTIPWQKITVDNIQALDAS